MFERSLELLHFHRHFTDFTVLWQIVGFLDSSRIQEARPLFNNSLNSVRTVNSTSFWVSWVLYGSTKTSWRVLERIFKHIKVKLIIDREKIQQKFNDVFLFASNIKFTCSNIQMLKMVKTNTQCTEQIFEIFESFSKHLRYWKKCSECYNNQILWMF